MNATPATPNAAHGPIGATGGVSVGELAEILKLPQSTVSRHLKTLADTGLVDTRRDGTSTYYRLSEAAGKNASRQLRLLAKSHLENDPQAKNDAHRLSAILRNREAPRNGTDFFGKHAPQWDQLRNQWFGDTFHLEGMLALLNPNWTVADIGTGTGAMLPLIAPHVGRVIAIDPSAAMLKGARSRVKDFNLPNVEIRQGSAEHLPLEKSTVDVALLTLVLAYTAEPSLAFQEVHRILKPGGLILILDLQPHQVELFREKLNHRHMGFSQAQLTPWLHAAGFANIRWHPLSSAKGRSKESATPIPDLFALRAEA
ncbi:MAG TPA: metalloregulator ArsR/SmtB family transcription factor [Phycisphaerae bacterium]|jgi:ArsR family transcriptional regulator